MITISDIAVGILVLGLFHVVTMVGLTVILGAVQSLRSPPQADAIKAAVDKANNRAADAFLAWRIGSNEHPGIAAMDSLDFAEWLRSGADAPGAAGKDGGR